MTTADLEFPVLLIAANGFLSSVGDRAALESCSKASFRNGYYTDLVVVDCRGATFRVLEACERRGSMWTSLLSRWTAVNLTLERTGHWTLEEEKDHLCNAMAKLPDQWEATEDLAQAQTRVRAASTVGQLHGLFLEE